MVEAVRDFTEGECGNNKDCFIRIEEFGRYKNISAGRSSNPNLNSYDYFVWKSIIDIFSMRISCLYDSEKTIERERYLKEMTPYMIYCLEKKLIEKNHVFILSAFPEFLLDYFPTKFWNENVKHSVNMSKRNNCKRPIFKNV